MKRMGSKRIGLWCALGFAGVFLLAPRVEAIPAFARKYKTSCQTCHVSFPTLTPFGESFRLNGFRFPEGLDEDYAKVEDFALGAEGYKKQWPEAIWPTTLTWVPPISVILAGEASYTPDPGTLDQSSTTFNTLASEAALVAGGTIGDDFSYYTELEFATPSDGDDAVEEVALERAYVSYKPFEDPILSFKIGLFEPGVMSITDHRRFNRSKYLATKQGRPGENGFSFDDQNRGIEAFGVLCSGRGIYNLGVIEGNRDFTDFSTPTSEKDVYLRLGYKIGGARLDGKVEGDADSDATANPRPWAERSLMLSVFGLSGTANIDDHGVGGNGNSTVFNMIGGDVRLVFEDAICTVGGTIRSDDEGHPVSATRANRVNSSNVFAEIQYVVFPWLIPSFRYENFNQTYSDIARERFDLTINILVRANVKTTLFYVYDEGLGTDDDSGGKHNNIFGVGLTVGF